ncbi:hypothetical protein JW905_11640 [bacterium]|nr:hypothetical protein [candidate division CSSED10-310 bacterium]
MSKSFTAGLLILAAMTAPAAAEFKWLQNDGFSMGGMAYYQMGFVATEICAATYTPFMGDYPVKLSTVRILVQDGAGGSASRDFVLRVWEDSGTTQPGALLLEETRTLTASTNWQDVDIAGHNIIVSSGSIRVGFEFTGAPPPSFCRDADGTITPHRNLIKLDIGTWVWAESLGLQGDWILRLGVETNYGGATATPTPSPTIPGATATPTPTPVTTPGGDEGEINWDAAEYFGLDAHGRLTVVDGNLDGDPGLQEQIDVWVWSQSDPYPSGISVTLYETSLSSDTFQSVYPHVGFTDAASDDMENLIHVADNDPVYARYLDDSPVGEHIASARWHAYQGISITLEMPSHSISDGDQCWLNLDFSNSGDTSQVDLYVLLDVFGSYFAYPSWNAIDLGLDHGDLFIPGAYQDTIEVLDPFTMPPVDPVGPLFFHAAMFEDGELTIDTMISNLSTWEFSLR